MGVSKQNEAIFHFFVVFITLQTNHTVINGIDVLYITVTQKLFVYNISEVSLGKSELKTCGRLQVRGLILYSR